MYSLRKFYYKIVDTLLKVVKKKWKVFLSELDPKCKIPFSTAKRQTIVSFISTEEARRGKCNSVLCQTILLLLSKRRREVTQSKQMWPLLEPTTRNTHVCIVPRSHRAIINMNSMGLIIYLYMAVKTIKT